MDNTETYSGFTKEELNDLHEMGYSSPEEFARIYMCNDDPVIYEENVVNHGEY